MSLPSVSVVMTAFNGARYLAAAIDSVLAQDPPVSEILVVDHGSTDASRDIVLSRGPPVRLLDHACEALAAARNHGLAEAKGEVIGWLDQDDLWTPGGLRCRLDRLAAEPGLGLVFGGVRAFASEDIDAALRARLLLPPDAAPGYVPGAMLARRDVFERIGVFDVSFRLGDFVEWYMRCRERGIREAGTDEIVLMRRHHPGNYTRRHRDQYRDYARAVHAGLKRRRSSGSMAI
jgi:glycosyltransferase involved in cell wall biosynthesis